MEFQGQSTLSGGAAVVEALRREGVTHVFCVPGESFLGVLDALYDAPEMYVLATRHEGGAAFMAEAFAKASGRLAVCMATRGVGAANLAIGVHAAQQDSTPLLALLGQVGTAFRHREAFQEVDLAALFAPISKWSVEATRADRLPELIHKAIRIATSGRPGPVVVALPEDVLNDPVLPAFFAPARPPRSRPSTADVQAACTLLSSARRPLILAGGGVLQARATEQLVALAEATETPVVAGWRRFDVFPHDHRLFLGSAGLAAAPGVAERLLAADALLVLGSRLSEITSLGYRLPAPGCQVVQVDGDPATLGANFAPAVAMLADVGLALDDLLAAVKEDRRWDDARASRRATNDQQRQQYLQARTPPPVVEGLYVDPALAIVELQKLLPPDAILVSDVGNFSGWLARYYQFRQPGTFLGPTSGAMGYGLPAAIAASLAHPGRQVVALVGDGSLLMTLSELETAVRARTPLTVLVFDNRMYGTIRMHQEAEHPGRVVATGLGTPDLARTAESFGAFGIAAHTNAELPGALRAALQSGLPALVHLHIDPARIAVGQTLRES